MEITELYESLKPLIPEDEMLKQSEWFETRMHSIKDKIKQWLLDAREQCKHDDGAGVL